MCVTPTHIEPDQYNPWNNSAHKTLNADNLSNLSVETAGPSGRAL